MSLHEKDATPIIMRDTGNENLHITVMTLLAGGTNFQPM